MAHPRNSKEITEYLPLVRYWARHYAHRRHQVLDVEDLIVVGMIGLMDAMARFKPDRHTLFKSYAEFRIRGEIVDELRRQDWMTRTERRKYNRYQKAETVLGHQLGRSPTRDELARVLPFEGQELDRLAQYETNDSIRSYYESDLPTEALRDSVSEAVELHDELAGLLNHLTGPMRTIMEMRYFEDASVEEIAQRIGLSLGRVSQLHMEALELMRAGKRAA